MVLVSYAAISAVDAEKATGILTQFEMSYNRIILRRLAISAAARHNSSGKLVRFVGPLRNSPAIWNPF
jgi:hypothetical protein